MSCSGGPEVIAEDGRPQKKAAGLKAPPASFHASFYFLLIVLMKTLPATDPYRHPCQPCLSLSTVAILSFCPPTATRKKPTKREEIYMTSIFNL